MGLKCILFCLYNLGMKTSEEHYVNLLGLAALRKVSEVELNISALQVKIFVMYGENTAMCPECGAVYEMYDRSAQRSWRHLDTMQFETILYCEPPGQNVKRTA